MSSERSVKDVFGPYNQGYGGEGGIRTHGTVSRTLAFEASTFNRSVTSPWLFAIVTDALVYGQCTRSWRNVILADPRCAVGTYRRSAKNDWMTATHSSPRTPAV